MIKVSTIKEAINLMAIEAERQGADSNDSTGVVRAIVAANLPGRENVWFDAWFGVCCELADRKARALGFTSEVARTYAVASEKVTQ